MESLTGIPRNVVLGFGLVRPFRSSRNTFFSRTVDAPETDTLAPLYNLSPAGICLVLLHEVVRQYPVINMITEMRVFILSYLCIPRLLLFVSFFFGVIPQHDYSRH